ncbi:MAG: SPOR domain-containing protein [bacterium]
MAERRGTGLTFGQLITLTFGFLLASVVIFVFGLWVGRDLAEQKALHQREPAHVPLAAAPTAVVAAAPAEPPAAPPTYPPMRPAPPTAVSIAPTATAIRLAPTATIVVARATATSVRVAATSPTPAAGTWTVQAYATNDTVRAVMLARTLRAKGFEASTATRQIGGATWYTVRVGRFRDRVTAKAMETKLREEEGLEAASVVAQ